MHSEPLDRPLLAKVLGMLGSSGDGEALAAARRADGMVRASGQDWHTILSNSTNGNPSYAGGVVAPQEIPSTGKVLHPPYGRTWRESVRWLIDTGTGTERERWVLDRLAVRMAAWPDHQKPRISPELAAEVVRIAGELNQQGEAA